MTWMSVPFLVSPVLKTNIARCFHLSEGTWKVTRYRFRNVMVRRVFSEKRELGSVKK